MAYVTPLQATASSQYNSDYSPSKAIDSTTSGQSHWISLNKTGEQWIQFDLGTGKFIDGIKVFVLASFIPTVFDIQISVDANEWITALLNCTISTGDTWVEMNFSGVVGRYVRYLMKSSKGIYYLITETQINITENYNTYGNYISMPISLSNMPDSLRIRWTSDEPINTIITVEYEVTNDNTNTPESWIEIENEEVLLVPQIEGCFLWLKYILETTDTTVTPTLQRIWLEESSAPQDKILITMDWWGRFNNAEDKIKVLYDASKGSLTGAGGAVESFEIEFLPEDLVQTPNPNVEEMIKAYPYEIIADLKEVTFNNVYPQETVKAYPYAIVLTLTDIGEINP